MSLRTEILAQPSVLSRLLASQESSIRKIINSIGTPKGIFIAARGTSDNAARYAKYIWGAQNGIPVTLAAPSLFSIYKKPPNLKDMVVIGISQSGESPDLLAVVEEANRQNCQTLAITNKSSSPLAEQSDYVIDIMADAEVSIAATKSYTAQLGAIAMLSASWLDDPSLWKELENIPGQMESVLKSEPVIEGFSSRYRYMDQCVVIGRGYNYATAYEWSLKLKELTYVVAQPYSSADFMHGPIALVSKGFPVFAIATSGAVLDEMTFLLNKLIDEHQAELFLISDQEDLLKLATCPVPLPADVTEWLSPLIGIIPAQLFSYHLTLVKGIDPDAPRGLSKVTLTT
jgi:glucosamine--fructose-6-phosphate aminotransferase (isomerizing)